MATLVSIVIRFKALGQVSLMQPTSSGLVKYALMHGQPVNSVLNGVLPIHIAASSGNDLVVQMLIDAGADVNAAR